MQNEKVGKSDALSLYMKSLKPFKPLRREEEHDLMVAYKVFNDLSARDKLITSNLKYACKLASGFKNYGVSFLELISEANKGLIDGIEKFDINSDVKVISYCKWWIIQRMQSIIKHKLRMPEDELPSEVNETLDFDDDTNDVYEDGKMDDTFITDEEMSEDERINEEFLEKIMEPLSKREIDIINMYYGRCGYKPNTLEKIGKKYNLTKERIRQIMEAAFKKIRSESMLHDCEYLSR